MKKKILITGAVVLVAAAVILGFILKNQVRENTDSTAVNVDIGQWDTTQNESQNYWNPDNHTIAKSKSSYYYNQTTNKISKISKYKKHSKRRLM